MSLLLKNLAQEIALLRVEAEGSTSRREPH